MAITQGSPITKADLDDLADEANLKLTKVAMGRTQDDIRRSSDPTYVPPAWSLGDDYAFDDPTELYPQPIGAPVYKASPRWGWFDTLNRIWKALWNIPDSVSWNGGGPYPFGYGDWDLFNPGSPGTNGVAWDRIAAYWTTQPGTGFSADDERYLVASPGPHVFCTLPDSRPDTAAGLPARFYSAYNLLAVYSLDQGLFTIYSGLFTPTVIKNGDGTWHTRAGNSLTPPTPDPNLPVVDLITFEDLPATTGLYGYYEVEYTYIGTDPIPTTDPTNYSDCYLEVNSIPPGNTGFHGSLFLPNEKKYYMWMNDGSSGRGANTIIQTAGSGIPDTTGTQKMVHYVEVDDWVWTKTIFRGGIYTDSKDSTEGGLMSGKTIHPRNWSVRAAMHVNTDTNLLDSDFLDFDSMEAKLSVPGTGTRVVDTNLRAMFHQDTKDALDDYPVPTSDPTLARAYLLDDLNKVINGTVNNQLYDLWIAAVLATITLRPGTRWLIERDLTDGELLKKMRRLILEDCYPTELNRLPAGYTTPAYEIFQMFLGGSPTGVGKWNEHPLTPYSYFCSNEDAEIIYLDLAIPQWCSNTALQRQMPDVRATPDSYFAGPKGLAWAIPGETTNYFNQFRPALTTIPSNYPIYHKKWFGILNPSNNVQEWPAGVESQAYLPYWGHDIDHGWVSYPKYPAIPAGEISYDAQDPGVIQPGFNANGRRLEYTVSNRNITIYVARSDVHNDYPDPNDPSTYAFKSEKGYFRYPEDFTFPEAIEGGGFLVTLQNNTSQPQAWQVVISEFAPPQPWDGISAPDPTPRFFPIQEPYSSQYPTLASTKRIWGDSIRFGPIEDIPNTVGPLTSPAWPVAYPCPQRGQHVREILIRRKPVRNAAGIFVPMATVDMKEKDILIGIMAGAGIISGAIYGSYPGDWCSLGLTQDVYTIAAGQNELRVAVSYFVLKGCPLAYYVKDADGNEDGEEFEIFCTAEFQPQVNNTFVPTGEVLKDSDIGHVLHVEGGWYGQPFVSNTFLWGDNLNDYTPAIDVRHGYHKIIQPPISARPIKQLYDLLVSITP